MKTKIKNQIKSNKTERKISQSGIIQQVGRPNNKSRRKIEKRVQQTQFLSRCLWWAASTSWLTAGQKLCLLYSFLYFLSTFIILSSCLFDYPTLRYFSFSSITFYLVFLFWFWVDEFIANLIIKSVHILPIVLSIVGYHVRLQLDFFSKQHFQHANRWLVH